MGIRDFLLAAFLCFIAANAYATCSSRGYGTTLGTSTTNDIIASSANIVLAEKHSIAWRMYINGAGGGSNGLVYVTGSGATTFAGRLNGGTNSFLIGEPWSTTRGQWTFVPAGTLRWQSIVITYDASSVNNDPIVYVNGTSVTVTDFGAAAAGTFGLTFSNLLFGNSAAGGAVGFNGMIADYSMWNDVILNQAEASAFAKGVSPLRIRRTKLVQFLPFCGSNPEPDYAGHFAQTITGTQRQGGPPSSGFPFESN